jgi:copper homeostasis protein (lipoprotein)
MHSTLLAIAVSLAAGWSLPVAAANDESRPGGVQQERREAPAVDWSGEPVTYKGEVPCSDCSALRMTLTLRPDRLYLLRRVYADVRKGQDNTALEMGIWDVTTDGQRLILAAGNRDPLQFAVRGEDGLRLLDKEGREIDPPVAYDLKRAATVEPIPGPFAIWGMYRLGSGAGTLRECLTGKTFAVAAEGDNESLQKAYEEKRTAAEQPLLVSLTGHLQNRAEAAGGDKVVVDRFDRAWPGQSCAGVDYRAQGNGNTAGAKSFLSRGAEIVADGVCVKRTPRDTTQRQCR